MKRFLIESSVLVAIGMFAVCSLAQAAESTPGGWDNVHGKRVLYFTKSAGYEHSVVKRSAPDTLSHSEQVLTDLGRKHGFEVACTKDGTVFTAENLAKYDVIAFYTSGDLYQTGTDQTPAMTPAGKTALLDAIKAGKGFVGFHASTDSFRNANETFISHGSKVDPFTALIGGEFMRHGPQQVAKAIVIDPKFPGCDKLNGSIELMDEWYTFKDFAPNLHVIQALETKGMNGIDYRRASFPYTWARMEGKGRVFFTGFAHREDAWTNPVFQDLILGGIGWAAGNVNVDVTPNLKTATPGYAELQPEK
jgi:uncharacterized protein